MEDSNDIEDCKIALNLSFSSESSNKHQKEQQCSTLNSQATNLRSSKGHSSFKTSSSDVSRRSKSSFAVKHEQKTHWTSLYKSNPEIPNIPLADIKETKELLFSQKLFSELDLHPHLVNCLENRFNVTKLTEVQEKTIPVLMNGKDILVKSCTGSGKTLAYAVPIVQKLQSIRPKIQRSQGVYALIILPTRELVLQSFHCFSSLAKAFTWIVPGYLIGGEKKKSEKARIRKGINILVATPGRLLDHLEHTSNLNLNKIEWLVIDEGDMLLEQGYEESVLKILQYCGKTSESPKVQTVLLSATLSRGVEKLAGISLKDPVYIDIASVDDEFTKMKELTVPAQLKQFFVVVPTKLRLVTISAFVIKMCIEGNAKSIIFFSSQCTVDFHFALFNEVLLPILTSNHCNMKIFKLHGNFNQEDRSQVYNKFQRCKSGILLCTDVAARGLHFPHVEWIIQYTLPVSIEMYIHRIGRTARIGEVGNSLLFIIPSEEKFIQLLQQYKMRLTKMDMNDIISSLSSIFGATSRELKQCSSTNVEILATNLQQKFEDLVSSEDAVHTLARDAFLSYVKAYSSYPNPMKSIIPFKMLHLGHVAKCFCLHESPSELGCAFSKPSKFERKGPKKFERKSQTKRKFVADVSEYGDGFDAWKNQISCSTKKFRKL